MNKMRIRNRFDLDIEFAQKYAVFVQSCAYMEASMEKAFQRILSITTPMSIAIFAKNSIARNREILLHLISLPEINYEEDYRKEILQALQDSKELSEFRNNIIHGCVAMIPEENIKSRLDYDALFTIHKGGQNKQGLDNSYALFVSEGEIAEKTIKAQEIANFFSTLRSVDFSKQERVRDFPSYRVKQ